MGEKDDRVMNSRSLTMALLAFLAFMGTGVAQNPKGAMATAQQLLDAFNRHDPAAMAALVDDRFELYYVSGGKSELSASGPAELERQMVDYFRSRPTVHSEIEGSIDGLHFRALTFGTGLSGTHQNVVLRVQTAKTVCQISRFQNATSPQQGAVGLVHQAVVVRPALQCL